MKGTGMKRILILSVILMSSRLLGGIHFHGRPSALEADGGSISFANTNTQLSGGTLRTVGAGSISNDSSEYLTCTNMAIEHKNGTTTKAMKVDGQLYLNDNTLTLDDNERLYVDGGEVAQTITVNADVSAPALIQGSGSFASDITVNSGAGSVGLDIRWQGELNKNIVLDTASNAAAVTLEDNLVFASGKGISVTAGTSSRGRINFNGHTLTVGGTSDAPFDFGGVAQTWSRTKLFLSGDISIESAIADTGSTGSTDRVAVNGNGHKMHVISGGIDGSSSYNLLTNIHAVDYGTGIFAGGGYWQIKDVIIEDSTSGQKIQINDGNLSGTGDRFFADYALMNVSITEMELLTDVDLTGLWYFAAGFNINGNGKTLNFDGDGYIRFSSASYFSDIILKNMTGHSFYASSRLYLNNVEWHDRSGNGAVCITQSRQGSNTDNYIWLELETGTFSDAGYLFDNDCSWRYGAFLDLLSDVTLNATWRFYTAPSPGIDGHGHVINLENGVIDYEEDLYLSNVTLAGMTATSLDRQTGHYLYLTDVNWIDSAGQSVHITGTTDTAGAVAAAQVTMDATNTGDLFGSPVTWENGAHIELLSDVTLSSTWSFLENSTIIGNGRVLDITGVAGALTVASGKTLMLRDVVLKGWGDGGELAFTSNNGTLSLSRVTVIMSGDITLGANELLDIQGPLLVVSGAAVFDATAGTTNHTWAGGTVLYDIGRTISTAPKVLFDAAANIEVGMIARTVYDYSMGDDGQTAPALHMEASLFLDNDIDTNSDGDFEARGRQLTLYNNSSIVIRGNGRTIHLGAAPLSGDTLATSQKLITVTGHINNPVALNDVILDGWSESQIDDPNVCLRYGDGAILRLRKDEALTTELQFFSHSGEDVVIDLNGHELDMTDAGAEFSFTNASSTLTIRNGRLKISDATPNLPKIGAYASPTVVLQDVDLLLADDTTLWYTKLMIKGNCSVTGAADCQLYCRGTRITIDDGACLRIGPGITLKKATYSYHPTITFNSNNATLFFDDATFDVTGHTSTPTYTTGTIRIDGLTTFLGDMTLGSATASQAIDIDILPAAKLQVNGAITYANAS